MTDLMQHSLWAWRGVFTQTNVAGGKLRCVVTPSSRMVFLYGMIGTDDYAADRTASAWIADSAGNIIARVLFDTTVDNEYIPFPNDLDAIAVANEPNYFEKLVVVGARESLIINLTGAVVQNETLTIAMRALIKDVRPTVTSTGSSGTPTITVTYNKVV